MRVLNSYDKRCEPAFTKRHYIKKHRSYYKQGATLAGLDNISWQSALENPTNFIAELDPLWHSHYLKFTNSSNTVLEPLKKLKSFCFPCMDELDLPFFNRTWMLGIHPVGFILEPEILFDGAYGLCADFFEHDILHTGNSTPDNPAHFLPAKILARALDSASIINRDHLTLDTLEYSADGCQTFALCQDQLDIPKEALELLPFETVHERNNGSLVLSSWDDYRDVTNHVFSDAKNSLRHVYCNLEQNYQKVSYIQVKRAALLLYCLNKKQFWDAKNSEEAENRRRKAWYHYNNLLFFNALHKKPSRAVLEAGLTYLSNPEGRLYKSKNSGNKIYTIIHGLSDRVLVLPENLLCGEPDDEIPDDGWTFYKTDNPAATVCRIKKRTFIPYLDHPGAWKASKRYDIHIFNDANSRIFKNIDNIQYDEKSGILIFRQPNQFVLLSLKGEHAPAVNKFARMLVKDIHLNSDNQTVQLFTPLGIQNLHYGTCQHPTELIEKTYAGQHLQAVDFDNTDFAHGDYSCTIFDHCDLSQTRLSWEHIATARFCGYSPTERARLEPAVRAAEIWLTKADGDLAERLKVVHKNGLLPFVILTDPQWEELLTLQPWCNAESPPLQTTDTPFQTLVANPSRLSDALCETLRSVLLDGNTSLKLGTPLNNRFNEKCSYPIFKHLLAALNDPEDIRRLVSQNHGLCTGKLDCFDSICFNPEKLKIPEDFKLRWISALSGLSFKNANLSGCDLKKINIDHCDFTDAQLEGTNFKAAILFTGNVFTRTNLRGACFVEAMIPNRHVCLRWISHSNCNTFEQADMRNCDMTDAHLGGCSFKSAVLDGARLGDLYLQGDVDLEGASLRDCWIIGRHDVTPRNEFAKVFLPALPKTSPTPQDQLNRSQMLLWLKSTEHTEAAKTLLSQLSPKSMDNRQRRHYIDLLEAAGQPDVELTEAEFNAAIEQENTTDIGNYLLKHLRSAHYQGEAALEKACASALKKCQQLSGETRSEIAGNISSIWGNWENRYIREQITSLSRQLRSEQ